LLQSNPFIKQFLHAFEQLLQQTVLTQLQLRLRNIRLNNILRRAKRRSNNGANHLTNRTMFNPFLLGYFLPLKRLIILVVLGLYENEQRRFVIARPTVN
jgi:hypothetical protein